MRKTDSALPYTSLSLFFLFTTVQCLLSKRRYERKDKSEREREERERCAALSVSVEVVRPLLQVPTFVLPTEIPAQ